MPELSRSITFHSHQLGFIHQLFYCTLYSQKRLPNHIAPGDDDNIKTRYKSWMKMAGRFTQQAAHSVAGYGITRLLTDNKSISVIIQLVGQYAQDHQSMMIGTPVLAQTSKIFSTAKPEAPLHPYFSLSVPVDFLDVNALHGELVTTMTAAAVQDRAAIFSLHPLPKAMHARAAANFRLISAFG
jgi:hypothetical protein